MKKIISAFMMFFIFCHKVAYSDVYSDNWKIIESRLANLVGQTESDVISLLGIPSATYKVDKNRFLEYTTHKYLSVDSGYRTEVECKFLVKFYKDVVIDASFLNIHNYCVDAGVLPVYFTSY